MSLMDSLIPKVDFKAIAWFIKDYQEQAYKLRGEFISTIIDLEKSIDEFIADYFSKDELIKHDLLALIITERLNFAAKISILKYIKEYRDKGELSKNESIIPNLKKIKDMRNFLAHRYLLAGYSQALEGYEGKLTFEKRGEKHGESETKAIQEIKELMDLANHYTGFFLDYKLTK